MEMMTPKEFAELTGWTLSKVRRLYLAGDVVVPGKGIYRGIKRGSAMSARVLIKRVGDAPEEISAVTGDRMQEAKRKKLEVEIALKQQQLKANREADEAAFRAATVSELRLMLEPLKEAFRECELTEKQAALINAALTRCMERLAR